MSIGRLNGMFALLELFGIVVDVAGATRRSAEQDQPEHRPSEAERRALDEAQRHRYAHHRYL